ncbi:hypothetical protein MKW94_005098 [Papaver nudicaule]|uniref:N-acetyltransferase domain-containing protein n=1 Tax=Papaver nudicaule TaxID=74823 RepID=A0AA41VMC0_PAPNU|nr:hypothetical protein [Papaver nudicaule]
MDPSRITIRPFKLSDIDDVMIWGSDEKVVQYTKLHPFISKEDGLKFLKEEAIANPCRRSICIDDHSIGMITTYPIESSDEHVHDRFIGYTIATQYWGQGIMTTALNLALNTWVLKEYPEMEKLHGFVVPENKASARVLEKVGFVKEGLIKNHSVLKGVTLDVVSYCFTCTTKSVLES